MQHFSEATQGMSAEGVVLKLHQPGDLDMGGKVIVPEESHALTQLSGICRHFIHPVQIEFLKLLERFDEKDSKLKVFDFLI